MATLSKTPAPISHSAQAVADLRGEWMVAEVYPRHEKCATFDLEDQGVGYCLPLVTNVRVIAGKRRKSIVPLFGGYLFCCCQTDDHRYAVYDSRHVHDVLRIARAEQRRFVEQLSGVEEWCRDKPRMADIDEFRTGRRARVRAGHSLANCRGVVDHTTKRGIVVLTIDILGAARPCEISPGDLVLED